MDQLRLIFVLDILDGVTVHAVGGMRDSYRPVHLSSKIVDDSDPIAVISAVRPDETYIADLNAITQTSEHSSSASLIPQIRERGGTRVMLDMGVRSGEDLELASRIADSVVIGTETASLELIEHASGKGVFLSIDIRNGEVLTSDHRLKAPPLGLLDLMNSFELEGIIILNLSHVGMKKGLDTRFIEQAVGRSDHPILVGGGIRGVHDLDLLGQIGVEGALVATAVHDGSIPLHLISHRAR
ncbi:MAG TPA: hypothetical protein ENG09_02780 [Candidatus Syntrophoarchaeum butanivorans]|uniref:Phosphoribosylformimino-5-aminoimidazole carboxamide ribotide isomerase n=1 Tax=Candidatus Syntropharchaeum butanivorans TaxID=1839936 RepID=A0A7C0X454_9EURY|nr:hypothetical protein [Candidatus Syntrophoarchaeum butanivorans]